MKRNSLPTRDPDTRGEFVSTGANREEHCWRIGGPVYMRDGRPCPECGALDTHETKETLRKDRDTLRARIAELGEALRPLAAAYSGQDSLAEDRPVHMPLMGTSVTVGDIRRAVKLVGG